MPAPAPANRIVTGHDEHGRAVVTWEGPIPYTGFDMNSQETTLFGVSFEHLLTSTNQQVPWQTREFPADNTGTTDAVTRGGPLNNDTGTLCRIVEFPPKSSSPMHRTVSLDYGILINGKITLELDDGLEREMAPGDVAVQRGTIHAWHNRSDSWVRMVFVLVAAKPVVINGEELGLDGIKNT